MKTFLVMDDWHTVTEYLKKNFKPDSPLCLLHSSEPTAKGLFLRTTNDMIAERFKADLKAVEVDFVYNFINERGQTFGDQSLFR